MHAPSTMLTPSAVCFPHPATCFKETGRKGSPPVLTEEPSNLGADVCATLLPISSKTEDAWRLVPREAHWPWVGD